MSHKSTNRKVRPPHSIRVSLGIALQQALALNANFYDRVKSTPQNRRIALLIVILAGISQAIGSSVISLINQAGIFSLIKTSLLTGLTIVAGYYLWTFAIWKIGQWLKPIDPTYNDLLIPVGFAYAPQVLNFLTLIPLLGRPIQLSLAVWSLLAVVVATREGLDISTRRAVVISLLFWLPLQTAIGAIQVLVR